CCGIRSDEQLRKEHRQWVEESISNGGNVRQPAWTESIAVGSKDFVDGIREKLQPRITDRQVRGAGDHYELREQSTAYNNHFEPKNRHLSAENAYYLDLNAG
ncbi:MAG: transposase, partial [Pseudomonadota bacterium]|nr:transposase [Pseudomonadota bacterium]